MEKIDLVTLKSIQLDILKATTDFCEKENIEYFLAYGTLLGAIRHNGYIPWDDDIDIVMPRPDYMRFIASFNQQNGYIKVHASDNDNRMYATYAKVCDERTVFDSNRYYLPSNLGIFIDIFPIDGASSDFYECYNNNLQIIKLRKNLYIAGIPFRLFAYPNIRACLRGLFHLTQRCMFKKYKKNMIPFYNAEIIHLSKKYDYDKCTIVSTYGTYHFKEVISKEVFNDFELYDFEGFKFRIPIGYDKWLRQIYGDYMQLPPKEQRKPHHDYKALYWKNEK